MTSRIRSLRILSRAFLRPLYRTGVCSVILAVIASGAFAQLAKRAKKSSGPRALGLVEILSNGRARIQTICIMVDGNFFDAGTYKATPVPMSVAPGTVYEGTRNGESIGLYTIADARAARGSWFGEGKWVPTGSEPKPAPAIVSTKRTDDEEAPPIMRRADSPSFKTEPPKPAESKPSGAAPPGPSGTDTPPKLKKNEAKETAPTSQSAASPGSGERPILRRTKPGDLPQKFDDKDFASTAPIKEHFLAVSDAGGPELKPFVLFPQPDDVVTYRRKLEAMATETVRERFGLKADSHTSKKSSPSVAFTNAQMQTFDLTNSNDPVLIFTAAVDPSEKLQGSANYFPSAHTTVVVVARVDIYGELRKLLAEATDDHHLDVYPRLEFLDAADADGDGAGELVFRETSDNVSGFVVYRAGLDKVWTVFDSLRNY